MDGLALIQRIYDQIEDAPKMIATGPFESPELTVEAAKAGALATVTMDAGASALIATMRRVRDHGDQKELGTLVQQLQKFRQGGGSLVLGQRDYAALVAKQRQMIEMYAQGLTDEQQLPKLRILPETQQKQLRSIFDKLKVRTRSQLVLLASQMPPVASE
jgi:DNA-binding NarL/FixJ family response regulator